MKYLNQRGDLSVYMALIILSIVLSSALLYSLVLSRQIKGAEDVVATEQALYAASTALERSFFVFAKDGDATVDLSGTINYSQSNGSNESASYTGQGWQDKKNGDVCLLAGGSFRQLQRHFKVGASDCDPAKP